MSAEFGDLWADSPTREIDAGPTPSTVEPDPRAGTWPEEISAVASSSFTLRGMGERPDDCGAYYPLDWCDECGEPHFRQKHCEQRTCPKCWTGNVARIAESVTARISGARHAADSYSEKRAVHAVVSPPPGEIRTVQDVYSGFSDAYDYAQDHGIRGGCAIFHGYRVKESVKREYRAIKELMGLLGAVEESLGNGESMSLWRYVRNHRRDWRSLTVWSPHYHIIGLAEDVAPADPEGDDGWVVWRIRDLMDYRMSEPVDGADAYSDTARLTKYLMSHASHETQSTKDSVRWFGEVSTVKFSMGDLAVSSRRMIEQKAHEAAFGVGDDDDDPDEPRTCDMDGCEGAMRPIWDAYAALRDRRFTERISTGAEDRLRAAADWMMGDLDPPPMHSEEEAKERLDELAEGL